MKQLVLSINLVITNISCDYLVIICIALLQNNLQSNNFNTIVIFKTIENESLKKITSLVLSYVILFWREHQTNSVIIAYYEFVKREYPIARNFYDKMTEFRKNNFLSEYE